VLWAGVAVGQELPNQIDGNTLENSISMEFVRIEPGTFKMGSVPGQLEEQPVHSVRITKPFYLGRYEVTNAQWHAVMKAVPSKWPDDKLPVHCVTWREAAFFCQQMSNLEAERLAKRTYRLPTEAEWEYACRAGSKSHFSFGDNPADLKDYAWFELNAGNQPHPVGQLKGNAWGLFDMHGNVHEWCADWYGPYPFKALTRDPFGPPAGQERVWRGGSFSNLGMDCRSAVRGRFRPDPIGRGDPFSGLRLVMSLDEHASEEAPRRR
jgi:formylglycine-generating enzyme required for sulfatase activity